MSDTGERTVWSKGTVINMAIGIHVVGVEKGGEGGVVVTYSDGTVAGYVVEELLSLRPTRETIKESQDLDWVTYFTWACHLN